MKKIIRFNFYLSEWFAGKKKEKIIPGTSFLFLTQMSFLFLVFFLIIIHFLPSIFSPQVAVAIVIGIVVLIMYGLQKNVEKKVRQYGYDKETIGSKEGVQVKRIIALSLFLIPFFLCFIVAILFYSD